MMLFLAEDDLVIKDQIHLENGLAVVIAVCLLLAVVLLIEKNFSIIFCFSLDLCVTQRFIVIVP